MGVVFGFMEKLHSEKCKKWIMNEFEKAICYKESSPIDTRFSIIAEEINNVPNAGARLKKLVVGSKTVFLQELIAKNKKDFNVSRYL